jgi:hypothetical protein
VGRQHRAHQDRGPAAPDSAFDQIARDILGQHRFYALLQAGQPLHSDHRLGVHGPIQPQVTPALVERFLANEHQVAGLEERKPQQPSECDALLL